MYIFLNENALIKQSILMDLTNLNNKAKKTQTFNKIKNNINQNQLKTQDNSVTQNTPGIPNSQLHIKPSGILTGLKSSITNMKNSIENTAMHSINKNRKQNSSLNESTYLRNIKTPVGTRSAVPHSVIQKNVDSKNPVKLRNGKLPTELNTSWGQQSIRSKINNFIKTYNK